MNVIKLNQYMIPGNEFISSSILYQSPSRVTTISKMNEIAKDNGSNQIWNVYERSFIIDNVLNVLTVERMKVTNS